MPGAATSTNTTHQLAPATIKQYPLSWPAPKLFQRENSYG